MEDLLNKTKEEYINAHRHDWTMHQEADWWLDKMKEYGEESEKKGYKRGITDKKVWNAVYEIGQQETIEDIWKFGKDNKELSLFLLHQYANKKNIKLD